MPRISRDGERQTGSRSSVSTHFGHGER
uniref:Uncharacterized protein n=1 Tax=Rhizophora mucronata TaxID=61149 RepID=A0A2P2PWB8_RHIMU